MISESDTNIFPAMGKQCVHESDFAHLAVKAEKGVARAHEGQV
jgi:hypothetical protein